MDIFVHSVIAFGSVDQFVTITIGTWSDGIKRESINPIRNQIKVKPCF